MGGYRVVSLPSPTPSPSLPTPPGGYTLVSAGGAPAAPRPSPSFEANFPTTYNYMGGGVDPWNFLGGARETAIDPLFGLGMTGLSLLKNYFSGNAVGAMKDVLPLQYAPGSSGQALGADLGAEAGLPEGATSVIEKILSGLGQANPLLDVYAQGGQAGLRMGGGIRTGMPESLGGQGKGPEGAAKFERGLGNLWGLLAPLMLDTKAPKAAAAPKAPPAMTEAGAGVNLLKNFTTPKIEEVKAVNEALDLGHHPLSVAGAVTPESLKALTERPPVLRPEDMPSTGSFLDSGDIMKLRERVALNEAAKQGRLADEMGAGINLKKLLGKKKEPDLEALRKKPRPTELPWPGGPEEFINQVANGERSAAELPAFFGDYGLQRYVKQAQDRGLLVKPFEPPIGEGTGYLIARDQASLDRLDAAYTKLRKAKTPGEEAAAHAEVGRALSYPEDSIAQFLAQHTRDRKPTFSDAEVRAALQPPKPPVDLGRRNLLKGGAQAGVGALVGPGKVIPEAVAGGYEPLLAKIRAATEEMQKVADAGGDYDAVANSLPWSEEPALATMMAQGNIPSVFGVPAAAADPVMGRVNALMDQGRINGAVKFAKMVLRSDYPDKTSWGHAVRSLKELDPNNPILPKLEALGRSRGPAWAEQDAYTKKVYAENHAALAAEAEAKASPPGTPPTVARLRAQGIPRPELRVPEGAPAPRKVFSQAEVAMARPEHKLSTRMNAGIDLKQAFRQWEPDDKSSPLNERGTIDHSIQIHRGYVRGQKSKIPFGTYYTTHPEVAKAYQGWHKGPHLDAEMANGAYPNGFPGTTRWSGTIGKLGSFKKTFVVDADTGSGAEPLRRVLRAAGYTDEQINSSRYSTTEQALPTLRALGYDSVFIKNAKNPTNIEGAPKSRRIPTGEFIDLRPQAQRMHAGIDLKALAEEGINKINKNSIEESGIEAPIRLYEIGQELTDRLHEYVRTVPNERFTGPSSATDLAWGGVASVAKNIEELLKGKSTKGYEGLRGTIEGLSRKGHLQLLPKDVQGMISAVDQFLRRGTATTVATEMNAGPNLRYPKVPLTRSERTGGRAAKMVESAFESSIPGAQPFNKFRLKQQKVLIDNLAEAVVYDVSKFKGSPEELGTQVQSSITHAQDGLKVAVGEIYKQIDEAAKGVQPSTALLKSFAKDLLAEMKAESKLIPPKALQRAASIVQKIAKAPARVSFSVMQDARSDLLAMTRATGDLIPGKSAGVAKRLAHLADQAMEDAAAKAGNSKLIEMVRDANARWRDMVETFNDSVVAKMAKAAPEKVHTLLRTASLDDIRRLRKTIPAPDFQAVKAAMLRDSLENSIEGELSKHMLPENLRHAMGFQSESTPTLRGPKFRKSLEAIGEDKLKAIFSDKELQGIYSVAEAADRIGRSKGSWIAAILNVKLAYTAGKAVFTLDPGMAVSAASMYLLVNGLSRIMTHSWGSSVLSGYLRAVSTNSPRVAFWAARLGELLDQEKERAKRQGASKPAPQPSPSPRP